MRATANRWITPLLAAGFLAACAHPQLRAPAEPSAKAVAPQGISAMDALDADPAAELPQLVELAKHGPTRAKYPQSDAVIAVDRDEVTLQGDGTMVERHKSVVRILEAQRGKGKFADVHVPWDKSRQALTLELARTINPDGTARSCSPEEISDIVPPQLANATIYSSALERVISFPAVDEGSVVELVFTRITKPTEDSPLGGEEPLAQWDPELLRVVSLTAPEGRPVHFAVEGMTLAPQQTSNGTTRTWSWTQTDVADHQPEPHAPPQDAVLPRLVYSFQPDWQTATAPVARHYRQSELPLSPAVKAQADRLVAGARNDSQRAMALYRFVAHDIRSISLPLGRAGYAPAPAERVLRNRYGDMRDKVALLLSLCAAEKIPGEAVLARSNVTPVVASVPTLAQFDDLVARVTVDGKPQWLDPVDADGQFGVAFAGEGNRVFALGSAALEERPLVEPELSVSNIHESYALDDIGDLQGKLAYSATGFYAAQVSRTLKPLKGDPLTQFFQESVGQISPVAIDKRHTVSDLLSVSGPVQIADEFAAVKFAPPQGKYRVFVLPHLTLSFLDDLPAPGMEKRQFPLLISPPRTLRREVAVRIPEGWKVAWVPPPLKGQAPGIRYASRCETQPDSVLCHQEIILDAEEISPDQYASFHEATTKLANYRQRVILLTRPRG